MKYQHIKDNKHWILLIFKISLQSRKQLMLEMKYFVMTVHDTVLPEHKFIYPVYPVKFEK